MFQTPRRNTYICISVHPTHTHGLKADEAVARATVLWTPEAEITTLSQPCPAVHCPWSGTVTVSSDTDLFSPKLASPRPQFSEVLEHVCNSDSEYSHQNVCITGSGSAYRLPTQQSSVRAAPSARSCVSLPPVTQGAWRAHHSSAPTDYSALGSIGDPTSLV